MIEIIWDKNDIPTPINQDDSDSETIVEDAELLIDNFDWVGSRHHY